MPLSQGLRDRDEGKVMIKKEKREMPTFLDVVEVLAFNKRKKIIRLRGKSKKYVTIYVVG